MKTMEELKAISQGALQGAQSEVANNERKSNKDPRFWVPGRDASNNGRHVVKFLSPIDGLTPPFVTVKEFFFKGVNNKWYNEKSLETIGQKDPANQLAFADMETIGKDELRKQSRFQKTFYIANVLVIEDTLKPENNGKVMLYKFGKTIFEKVSALIEPPHAGREVINVFAWEGSPNFEILIKEKNKFVNYDDSMFLPTISPIAENEQAVMEIANQTISLWEFIDPAKFESYETLDKRVHEVLGRTMGGEAPQQVGFSTATTTVSSEGTPAPTNPPAPSGDGTPASDEETPAPVGDPNQSTTTVNAEEVASTTSTAPSGGIDKGWFENAKGGNPPQPGSTPV